MLDLMFTIIMKWYMRSWEVYHTLPNVTIISERRIILLNQSINQFILSRNAINAGPDTKGGCNLR